MRGAGLPEEPLSFFFSFFHSYYSKGSLLCVLSLKGGQSVTISPCVGFVPFIINWHWDAGATLELCLRFLSMKSSQHVNIKMHPGLTRQL